MSLAGAQLRARCARECSATALDLRQYVDTASRLDGNSVPALNRPHETKARQQRFSLPSGMAQITVRLELLSSSSNSNSNATEPIVGHLWDISHRGGCISVPGLRRIVVPAGSRLQLRDPISHALHRLEAELRWCTALSHSTFVGLLFTGGPAPSETFLASYMRTSWTDAVPGSRATWSGI